MNQFNERLCVIFASNNKFFSLFIKLFTLSQWCHCAVLDEDGYVIDTTLFTGVRRIHFNVWKEHYSKWEMCSFPVKSKKDSLAFLNEQVGKKYDPLGIFSFIVRKNYEDKGKWFCSELTAKAIGIEYKPWRLSPVFLYRFYKTLRGYLI